MKDDNAIRAARAEMDAAKTQSERTFSKEPRTPRRYKRYDKIKDHVSVRTVDLVIIITSLLIVAALVFVWFFYVNFMAF